MRLNHVIALLIATALATLLLACQRPSQNAVRADSTTAQPTPLPPAAPERLDPIDVGAAKLQPRDQADTSFRAFRLATLRALNARDTSYLYSILTRDIKNSFGGDDGIDGFKRTWKMDQENSPVWDALARVLRLGGKQVNNDVFVAPYVHAFWPDTVDAFDYVAVTSASARVYEKPAFESAILGTTSYAIVELLDWRSMDESGAASPWAHIELPNGSSGWVKGDDVYSPVGWRAFFILRGGKWRMQTFVAGD